MARLSDSLAKRLRPLTRAAGALRQKLPENLQKTLQNPLSNSLPNRFKETLYLRGFGLFRIPLLFFISPSVVELTEDLCVIQVPLNRRTRNHLGSMYFGVLASGADCAAGLVAMQLVQKAGMTMVFKDFQAEFLKRAEGDVLFRCEEGRAVRELVKRAESSGTRENLSVRVTATVPAQLGDEPVGKFVLTLSIKKGS